jgi:acetylornithine deacetylase/succinyl-diaminopimelate desuccinylase-like protein
VQALQAWIESRFPKIREDLYTFLRFKTISSDPAMRHEQDRCAEWLHKQFSSLQCKSEVIPTRGLPLVYAEDLRAGPNAPTLLIYGHYDVQPVDPIELWNSDPFEPVEKNGSVYARGAVDDKGQVFYTIAALMAMRENRRPLPVNLKFCIEGEEESGSEGLSKALPKLKEKIAADYLLVVDFDILEAEIPSINLGARGIITLDVLLKGSKIDLHSGGFGGIAYNPNRAAAELIAQCWDANGRVQIPHFYDDVQELSKEEKSLFSKDGLKKMAIDAGIEVLGAEKGVSLRDANWLQPTFEINGLFGGYAGIGVKTVIPAEAHIKISCRLVPNQDPHMIGQYVADFLRKKVKKGMQIEVNILHGGKAYRGRADSKLAIAVAKAYEEIFHRPCEKILSGGSIPVVSDLMTALKPEVVGMGYGLYSDNVHAPNEHFGLDRFKKGILTVVRAIENLGGK